MLPAPRQSILNRPVRKAGALHNVENIDLEFQMNRPGRPPRPPVKGSVAARRDTSHRSEGGLRHSLLGRPCRQLRLQSKQQKHEEQNDYRPG